MADFDDANVQSDAGDLDTDNLEELNTEDTENLDDAGDDGAGDGEPNAPAPQAATPKSPREMGLPFDTWAAAAEGYKNAVAWGTRLAQQQAAPPQQQAAKQDDPPDYVDALIETYDDPHLHALAREVKTLRDATRQQQQAAGLTNTQQVAAVINDFATQHPDIAQDPALKAEFLTYIDNMLPAGADFAQIISAVNAGQPMPAWVAQQLPGKINLALKAIGREAKSKKDKDESDKRIQARAGALSPTSAASKPQPTRPKTYAEAKRAAQTAMRS